MSQGALNATAYFEAIMAEVLTVLVGMERFFWVNDSVIWAKDGEELVCRLDAILAKLVERGLYRCRAWRGVFSRPDQLVWTIVFGRSDAA